MTRQPKFAFSFFALLLMFGAVMLAAGCGGPKRVEAPQFDPEAASADAISMYDEDGDGELSKKELKLCGSLLGAMEEIDTDGSKTISQAEIKSRVEHIMQGRDGRISIACRVVKGNSAVQMATVTFEPEEFMGSLLEPASGETNSSGMAVVGIDDELGGVLPGFYKVRISRQNKSGKEMIKGKYNEETVLGQEVTSGSMQLSQGIIYNIK